MLITLLGVLLFIKNSIGFFVKRRNAAIPIKQRENKFVDLKSLYKAKRPRSQRNALFNKAMSNFISQQAKTNANDAAGSEPTANSNAVPIAAVGASVIVFKGSDKMCCYEITDQNVTVVCSSGNHDHGSSKVKQKNIVDYKWEVKNYPGHLVAVHIDGKHLAYVINVNGKLARMEGMVRVVNVNFGLRALIKGMSGEVLDLQFAHMEKERILACVDLNSLYIHKIDLGDNSLICNLILKIEDPLVNYTPKYDKISWCPFVDCPGEDDEDSSKLIVWARGSLFQCFNINEIVAWHGTGKIHPQAINSGYLKFFDETVVITWIALSPDGTTLGVASIDGAIRFYQVYFHEKTPRCLHHWKPHFGKPVSSFFFLDNLTRNSSDTYWKYAITGAADNTEFKIWDCGSWDCLQTVKMTSANDDKKMRFIAEIDRTASYLVISNLDTRTCYVLQIVNTNNLPSVGTLDAIASNNNNCSIAPTCSSTSTLTTKGKRLANLLVYIKSIAEFPLSSGILSFSILDAAVRRYKCTNDNFLCDEYDDYDEETNSVFCAVIHLFAVQSKSLQDCHILYQPSVNENSAVASSISNENSDILSQDSSMTDTNSMGDSLVIASKRIQTLHLDNVIGSDDDALDGVAVDDDDDANLQPLSKEGKALEVLLGITASVANPLTVHTNTTVCSSAVPNVVASTPPVCSNIKTECNVAPQVSTTSGYNQVNLMTPDEFSSTSDKKTPECVSSEVLNTILMLASVTSSAPTSNKSDSVNLLSLVNNKIIEDQEHQKLQLKQTLESQKKFIAIDNNPGRIIGEHITSGCSSPSLEVQEIMSLQDYEKVSFNVNELLEQSVVKSATDAASVQGALDEDLDDSAKKSHSLKNWPKVPDVHKVAQKHSTELQNAANLISQAVSASTAVNLNNNHAAPKLGSSNVSVNNTNNNSGSSGDVHSELTAMNAKISQILETVNRQSIQINNLQCFIADMKKNNPLSTAKGLDEFSFKLEMQLSKLMEEYLKRYEAEHTKKLSAFMAGREAQNREIRDTLMQLLNQFLLSRMGEVVSNVFTIEIQRQLMPMLSAKLDKLQQQAQMDMKQKLGKFDLMMKENISQVCKSKNIIDAFGKSVLMGVQGSLQAAFIESMSSTLIPAYEKSSQNMFKQLHEAFSVGIKEFMEQFDSYLQQLQPVQDSTEEILNKFASFRQHLDSVLLKHRNTVTDAMSESRKDIKSLEILLTRQVQDAIRTEVRKSFETQTIALRSQTNTPAPIYDLKETIKHLLLQGHINKAFHQALLANDLSLVEFTLKQVDHNAVFHPECCLEQKVLLSLIQQISADMSNHNETKQNYLAEALLSINTRDSITREHAPKVLQELYRNCQIFLMNYPKSPQYSNVRMLMKAVHSYNDQF